MPYRRLVNLVACIVLLGSLLVSSHSVAAAQANDVLTFSQTGHTLRGEFRRFWETSGGLAIFGYPLTEEQQEQTAEGNFVVQYFERNRFELHPQNQRPYDVLLGRLGAALLPHAGTAWITLPQPGAPAGCLYVASTAHTICGTFLQYWQSKGVKDTLLNSYSRSLALFGAPLTEPQLATNSSGDKVLTQWFERARLEDHGAKGGVLLGLLGRELLSSPCPLLPPIHDAAIRPSACLALGTDMSLDANNFAPYEQVSVWLTAPDKRVFGGQYTLQADGTGTLYNLNYPTNRLWSGQWYWVLEGNQSKHTSVVFFYVYQP